MITYKKTEDKITLCKIDSSNLFQSVYYEDKQFLYLFFKKGNVYSYQPISKELYEGFEKAESQGKYLNQFIKNNTSIAYRKETVLKEHELNAMIGDKFK
jgi:hypothetical protein